MTSGPISGFPEYLPKEQIAFDQLVERIRVGYQRFGFAPIETPAVERLNVLIPDTAGDGDRQIYALSRVSGHGSAALTKLGLHFDLTVPLARYVAANYDRLTFPFRPYQIQKVWRGERAQSGRYREFYQCDIDIIGDTALDLYADAEIAAVIHEVFSELQIGRFVTRLSNRRLLDGLLDLLGVTREQAGRVMSALDSIERLGFGQAMAELVGPAALDSATAERLIEYTQPRSGVDEQLRELRALDGPPALHDGISDLAAVVESMRSMGVPDDYFAIDLRIARGLDYYTGTMYETVLVDHVGVGSVCGGGRYDNLAGRFSRRTLPGVGMSIGLTRLFAKLLQAGRLNTTASTLAPVMVTTITKSRMIEYFRLASQLRASGVGTEVYLGERALGEQVRYARRRGFRLVVFAGDEEFRRGELRVKNLATDDQSVIPIAGFPAALARMLAELGSWP